MLDYAIYRLKYRYGRYLPLKVPVDVSLELSSSCNQRCGYCYHHDQTKLPFKPGNMSWKTAKKIIDECEMYGVNSIKTNWKGESTINPHFSQILKYAKIKAHGPVLQDRITNSNFKFSNTRDDIFEGLACQTKVKVSFDSFIPKVFETQRFKGVHKITLANIDRFYDWPGRDNELVIQAVRTKLNKDEDIEGQAKKRWPSATISIRDVVEGRLDNDIDEYKHRERDFSNRQSCLQAHVRLIFNHLGQASPCCPDIKEQLNLGNINEMSLRDIFNSPRAKALRDNLKSKTQFKFDPCKTCSSFESYKGYKPNWSS